MQAVEIGLIIEFFVKVRKLNKGPTNKDFRTLKELWVKPWTFFGKWDEPERKSDNRFYEAVETDKQT